MENININKNITDKNAAVLGKTYRAEIVRREEVNGKIVATAEAVDLHLNPIPIEQWKEMEAALLTRFDDVQMVLISFTTGKERQWLEKNLHGDHLQPLFEACKEINKGFFTRFAAARAFEREMKKLLSLPEPEAVALSSAEKSEAPQS